MPNRTSNAEALATEIAQASVALTLVLSDGKVTPAEFSKLEKVREELRSASLLSERVCIGEQMAIQSMRLGPSGVPNKHVTVRIRDLARREAATGYREAALRLRITKRHRFGR